MRRSKSAFTCWFVSVRVFATSAVSVQVVGGREGGLRKKKTPARSGRFHKFRASCTSFPLPKPRWLYSCNHQRHPSRNFPIETKLPHRFPGQPMHVFRSTASSSFSWWGTIHLNFVPHKIKTNRVAPKDGKEQSRLANWWKRVSRFHLKCGKMYLVRQ